jgi:DNA primase
MNILSLLASDGFQIKRVASTWGGEYAGPCPFCRDGQDRFRVWPEQKEGGRWWCRQCGKSGDAIQYLREFRNMSFREACTVVGKVVLPSPSCRVAPGPSWQPRKTNKPGDIWQARAQGLVEEGKRQLFQPHGQGQKLLKWLRETRGLLVDTVKAHHLGFQSADRWESPGDWGLEPVLKGNGLAKKIWLPKGLIIPHCLAGHILRIRLRRPRTVGDPRYYLVRGSDTRAMVWGLVHQVFVVVESELDGMLLYQEAGDLAGVVALGNAQSRPDEESIDLFGRSKLILLALDADEAGAKEAWRWWTEHFPQAQRWPPIDGKDPGEMWQMGINLRSWVMVGIEDYRPKPQKVTL